MTTDLEGLWADCQLGLLADYYEDLGDSSTAEALHWIMRNSYRPYSLENNHAYGYWFATTDAFYTNRSDEFELIKWCVLPAVIWQQMPADTTLECSIYYKRYSTARLAYEAFIEGYKLAVKEGWRP